MDYFAWCELFYASHFLPIALYDQSGFLCASGFYDAGDPYQFVLPKLIAMKSPAIYVSSDTGYYGIVKGGDNSHFFIFGPAYSTPVTAESVRSYMRKIHFPESVRQKSRHSSAEFHNTPTISFWSCCSFSISPYRGKAGHCTRVRNDRPGISGADWSAAYAIRLPCAG